MEETPWVWENDEGEWEGYSQVDAELLEDKYLDLGPKANFVTTAFSWNKGHKTRYFIDFAKGTQKNMKSGAVRKIKRGDGKELVASVPASWEWWEAETKKWKKYVKGDNTLIEAAFLSCKKSKTATFLTKNLTFNKGYNSQYVFDFIVMSQINTDSGTSRKMRRKGGVIMADCKIEDEGEDEDAGFGAALADATKGGGGKSSAAASNFTSFKFNVSLPSKVILEQKKLGTQSYRGKQDKSFGPAVSKDQHGSKCFEEMLKNEKEFAAEWVVFYHSYAGASLIYEVQAAIAAVLFRFKSEFATLPRLLWKPFGHIPDAEKMLVEFPKWSDRDHNPAFRGVGLCATSSLLAHDSEAPPKSVFLSGYSVGPLTGLLEKLLVACSVNKSETKKLADDIVKLAVAHGLDCSAHGGKSCKSGRAGHFLQIFIRRELVNKFVYPAFPYGVPDKTRDPLDSYLATNKKIEGQVRITANPDVFLQAKCVRMFTFSADSTFHNNRVLFQQALTEVLSPLLSGEAVRVKAARGIFGGSLPEWWTPEDQGSASKMEASRYKSSTFGE